MSPSTNDPLALTAVNSSDATIEFYDDGALDLEIFGKIVHVSRYLPGTAPLEETKTDCTFDTYQGDNPLNGSIYKVTLGDSEGGTGVYIQLTADSAIQQLPPASELPDNVFKIKGQIEELVIHDHSNAPRTKLEAPVNLLGFRSNTGEWHGGSVIFVHESVNPGTTTVHEGTCIEG